MMQHKIKLSDVYWAYIDEIHDTIIKDTVIPVILNTACTRYKDLSNDYIYSMGVNEGSMRPATLNLKKAIAELFGIPEYNVTVWESADMLIRYGRGPVPYFSNRTLNKYGNYMSGRNYTGTRYSTSRFCEENALTQKGLVKMAKVFTNSIHRDIAKGEKLIQKEKEYEEEHFSF